MKHRIGIFFFIVFVIFTAISNVRSECCQSETHDCDQQCGSVVHSKIPTGFINLIIKTSLTALQAFVNPLPFLNKLFVIPTTFMLTNQLGYDLCFHSGIRSNQSYSNVTFNLPVEDEFDKSSLSVWFDIETSLDTFIFELKKTIRNRFNYRCDEQRLWLFSRENFNELITLSDGKKLGDYVNITKTNSFDYQLRVTKVTVNKYMDFTLTPNVTHYEYALMSAHVYQPKKTFLNGWKVTIHNPSNKNGLALAVYVNDERRQCVVAFRGTDPSQSIFTNMITNLRLFFTNHAIDTFDSARLLLNRVGQIYIENSNLIQYHVSFTGHSLGGALAQSYACIYQSHGVTFDSPGMNTILSNDPSCLKHVKQGYRPDAHIHIYLGTYANLVNAVDRHFGEVICLTQLGMNNENVTAGQFPYIYSSLAAIDLAVCIFANIVKRGHVFILAVWFIVTCCIRQPWIICVTQYLSAMDSKIFNIFEWYAGKLPLVLTVLLLCHSMNTLATCIEYCMSRLSTWLTQRLNRLPHRLQRILDWIKAFFGLFIDFNSVLCRFAAMCMLVSFSFLITIVAPFICYFLWMMSVHSIDTFVKSFDPSTGNAYKGERIEPTDWPKLFDHLTDQSSRRFLLTLLIIQSYKALVFVLFPKWIHKLINFLRISTWLPESISVHWLLSGILKRILLNVILLLFVFVQYRSHRALDFDPIFNYFEDKDK